MLQYLGIVGRSVKASRGPVQADRFERLARFVGGIEQTPALSYPALHAAWHAFVNGVDRVIFSSVAEPYGDEAWIAAMKRLFQSDPLGLVVAPGGPSEALAEAFRSLPFTRTSCLWVDEDPGARDEQVRAGEQEIPTISPGRRTPELLPASALIAPLHLGVVTALLGTHDPPTTSGWLKADAYGRIVLAKPLDLPGPRLPPRPEAEVSAVQFRIDRAIAKMVEPILLTENVSPALYRRLEREAAAILEPYKKKGEIVRYSVRCDSETSEDAGGPVIEIRLVEPKRVEEIILRCHKMVG